MRRVTSGGDFLKIFILPASTSAASAASAAAKAAEAAPTATAPAVASTTTATNGENKWTGKATVTTPAHKRTAAATAAKYG